VSGSENSDAQESKPRLNLPDFPRARRHERIPASDLWVMQERQFKTRGNRVNRDQEGL
jgi:hypothetical protein